MVVICTKREETKVGFIGEDQKSKLWQQVRSQCNAALSGFS